MGATGTFVAYNAAHDDPLDRKKMWREIVCSGSNVSATARFLDMGRTSPLKDASDRTGAERIVTTAQFSSQRAGL